MNPLLVKTLLRFLLFHAYVFFVAWIFTLIEKRDESPHERMQTLLTELRKEVAINNNMTDEAFNKFVKKASEAIIAGDELGWNFLNSCGFVFATLTTIGDVHILNLVPCRRKYSQSEHIKAVVYLWVFFRTVPSQPKYIKAVSVYSSVFHQTVPSFRQLIDCLTGDVFSVTWYKITMQSFFLLCHAISHLSVVSSLLGHSLKACVYTKKMQVTRGIFLDMHIESIA